MTDEILIDKFLKGHTEAFNTLVWRWEKPLYNFILRYLGDSEQAKDVLQNTFIRAYKSLPRLKDHSRFSTWLYQIAHNQCHDCWKARRHDNLNMADLENDEDENQSERKTIVDPDSGPDKSALNSEIAEYLRRALLMIPEEQRVVIIMKEYHGLKFTEIEAILQIPLNTIKSRLYYGLSAMQKIFRQWGLDREDLRYEM